MKEMIEQVIKNGLEELNSKLGYIEMMKTSAEKIVQECREKVQYLVDLTKEVNSLEIFKNFPIVFLGELNRYRGAGDHPVRSIRVDLEGSSANMEVILGHNLKITAGKMRVLVLIAPATAEPSDQGANV